MKRRIIYTAALVVLVTYSVFSSYSLVVAQSLSQSELRQMVWTAAEAIESGNIDSAKEILEGVSSANEVPADVQMLIEKLEVSIEASVLSRPGASLERVLADEALSKFATESSMSQSNLQQYVTELTSAVGALFRSEK